MLQVISNINRISFIETRRLRNITVIPAGES